MSGCLVVAFTLLVMVLTLMGVGADDEHPCNQQFNTTWTPNPTVAVTKQQVMEASNFLALLSNSTGELPTLNKSLSYSVRLMESLQALGIYAKALYRDQTIAVLASQVEVALFGPAMNKTFLSTLMDIYTRYQAASNNPPLQQQIKAQFLSGQKLWAFRAAALTDSMSQVLNGWGLQGRYFDAFNNLTSLLKQCALYPSMIAEKEAIIARINASGCDQTCRELMQQVQELKAEEAYCQENWNITTEIYFTTQTIMDDLWGKVQGVLAASTNDARSGQKDILDLDLDSIIFNLMVQSTTRAWAESVGVSSDAYSFVYYACRSGFIPPAQ